MARIDGIAPPHDGWRGEGRGLRALANRGAPIALVRLCNNARKNAKRAARGLAAKFFTAVNDFSIPLPDTDASRFFLRT